MQLRRFGSDVRATAHAGYVYLQCKALLFASSRWRSYEASAGKLSWYFSRSSQAFSNHPFW